MKIIPFKFSIFSALLLSFNFLQAQVSSTDWLQKIGSNTEDDAAYAIASDNDGNFYVTGSVKGSVDIDPGIGAHYITTKQYDGFLSKHDSLGNLIWANTISGIMDDAGYSILVDDESNVYVSGEYHVMVHFDPNETDTTRMGGLVKGDGFLCKYYSDGSFAWVNTFGDVGVDERHEMAFDHEGNILISGIYSMQTTFGNETISPVGEREIFVSKMDTAGNFLWTRTFEGENSNVKSVALKSDNLGNTYILGDFTGTIDFDPGASSLSLYADEVRNVFLVKLDTDGDLSWAHQVGDDAIVLANSMVTSNDGNVYVAGVFHGAIDVNPGSWEEELSSENTDGVFETHVFMFGWDINGDFIWGNSLDESSGAKIESLEISEENKIYAMGTFTDRLDFDFYGTEYIREQSGKNGFICEWDELGFINWVRPLVISQDINIGNIHYDGQDNLLCVGGFQGTLYAHNEMMVSNTSMDIFMYKMSLSGNLSVEELQPTISVYPNPTNGGFTIQLGDYSDKVELRITNIKGQLLQEEIYHDTDEIKVNLHGSPGVYFIELMDEKGMVQHLRMVKK